ncbi:hypothetical protein [Bacillus niameyensis]|uniref:hypothetical protein n=1 Tax=Bacillus niameyensis TaxID=1522308 RepID=UPI000784CAB6|nr:hypothetical protein [Bacillus niameyensis]
MATFTAQILIGQKHSYDSGIINISHSLFLSENSRPAWILTPMELFKEQKQLQTQITWIPTLENMLEDALVMIGLYVLQDKKLITLANNLFGNPEKSCIELYDDIKPEHLKKLYEQARQIESSHKIVLSVYEGSSILNQLSVLDLYQNDKRCVSRFIARNFHFGVSSLKQVES